MRSGRPKKLVLFMWPPTVYVGVIMTPVTVLGTVIAQGVPKALQDTESASGTSSVMAVPFAS